MGKRMKKIWNDDFYVCFSQNVLESEHLNIAFKRLPRLEIKRLPRLANKKASKARE